VSDDVSTTLAENLKRLREESGLSQQALADRSGVPRPTVAHLESGAANPTLAVVTKLARALGVSLDGLVEPRLPPIRVLEATELRSERHAKTKRTRLLPEGVGREVVVERIVFAPGGRARLEVHPGSVDVIACERGELHLASGALETAVRAERVAVLRGSVECSSAQGAVAYRVGGLTFG
jgi:transcriptional regulator with XRE-family HTH domain